MSILKKKDTKMQHLARPYTSDGTAPVNAHPQDCFALYEILPYKVRVIGGDPDVYGIANVEHNGCVSKVRWETLHADLATLEERVKKWNRETMAELFERVTKIEKAFKSFRDASY